MNDCVKIADILLPKKHVDLEKWACIACDQFTSQPDYWTALAALTDGSPSALHAVYPEVFLETTNQSAYVERINETMKNYVESNLFDTYREIILVERSLQGGAKRFGLMIAIDLEAYEYTPDNDALIKATERTVVERLPVRIKIRENAILEMPHIMLLMDDRKRSVIEPLAAKKDRMEKLYETALNMGGGSICGYKVPDAGAVIESITRLIDKNELTEKYGTDKAMLFAVGDGNHSLATAKECWNNLKSTLSEEERGSHPARYALAELVNLHDVSLVFEPIHRVVFGATKDFVYEMTKALDGDARIKVVLDGEKYILNCNSSPADAIADIQNFIDEYMQDSDITIDYIHGDEYLLQVAQKTRGAAIFMPTLSKESLFDYVIRRGVLPRKAFSMGRAEDKRYYLEARKIK